MQRPLSQLAADTRLRSHAGDDERELKLLTQFMVHDSVASLAEAIAERLGDGMRGGDLITAAGLGSNRSDS